jgi:hypothetical protein
MATSLGLTLEQFGMAMPSPEAQSALGRLIGLELASHLGLRPARRALARERSYLLRSYFQPIERRETQA